MKEICKPHSRPHERIRQSLEQAGFSADAAEAMLLVDSDNFQYVRRVMKGDIPANLMQELGNGLDVTLFHALSAMVRIQNGYGRDAPQEATVGLLAEEMNIDPSRASRIAADLVDRGYLVRAVSQDDGRRSVLEATDQARELIQGFFQAKWQRTMKLFASWSEEDIATFSALFHRYCEGMRELYPSAAERKG